MHDWFGFQVEHPTQKSLQISVAREEAFSTPLPINTVDTSEVCENLCSSKFWKMENTGALREWFQRVDSNKTGNITAPQLQSALEVGNLRFSLSIVQQMIRMYDFDMNGTMNFEEFVALNKFLLKVQNAFAELERGRGYLTPDDVYEALLKVGFSLDSPAFYTVCESFDHNKRGMVQLDDFISLCIFVQSARNLFNSFDTSKQGRVTLDFNQFVYCTANCRI